MKLGAPLSKRISFRGEAGVPSRARKVLAATQARSKKGGSCNAHKGALRGLHAKDSLTSTVMNPFCGDTSNCLFSLGTGKKVIVSDFCRKTFELNSRFCHSCG